MTSNEFLINMKPADIPPYDGTKHFFEQPISTIQFFEEEKRKLLNGITIGGVFIHPWLYFHLNYFKTPIPTVVKGRAQPVDIIRNPTLRDNEWYMAENYIAAEKEGLAIMMYGSRRFSKSVIESSILHWNALTRENSTVEISCGSSGDLKNIENFLQIAISSIHPAFALPTIKSDWGSHIQFGYKIGTTRKSDIYSNIFVKNLEGGKTQASKEANAGGAPACVIFDEVGKFDFLESYLSLLPAISTPMGVKAVVLLSGTSGTEALSNDAKKVLNNPLIYKIKPMDWDLLESKIKDKRHITWTRKVFGMYIPPQMAYEVGVIKNESNLADYLSVDSPELKNINISVTDWEVANNVYHKLRKDKEDDKVALTKEILYHPLDPEECFMGGLTNIFPVIEAKRTHKKLLETGEVGKNVNIAIKEGGGIQYTLSEKTRTAVPFEGGVHDAPVVLYGEPPSEKPERHIFVAGLDPYKQAESGTDSVGSTYVLERKLDLGTPLEIIRASYASRPHTMLSFNRTCETLYDGFNAECMMENADTTFLQYLEMKQKAHIILADGVDWSKMINPNANPRTQFGFYPTTKNIEYLLNLTVAYAWEKVIVGYEDDNITPIEKLGVELIPDPDLLMEMINYKPGKNADRIRAFGAALAWARHLDKLRILPNKKLEPGELEARRKKAVHARVSNKGAIPMKKNPNPFF